MPEDQPATLSPGSPDLAALQTEIAADVRRVSERLRTMSATRLAGPPGPSRQGGPAHPSRAAAGRAAAQALADAAAGLAAAAGTVPPRRSLPELSDLAVGDQVAVTGHDLLAALAALSTPDAADPPSTAARAVRDAARALADVRRRL